MTVNFTLKNRRDEGNTPTLKTWGANCEYGVLRDILLGPAENFKWLETSAFSKRSFRLGLKFDAKVAQRQHAEMVAAYHEANVKTHFLPSDKNLPYEIFARDSSLMTPFGAIINQMKDWWRRGEYASTIKFYQGKNIPIYDMVTAGSFEGGDFMMLEPGLVLCGYSGDRSQEVAVRQIQSWFEKEGWGFKTYALDPFYVHMDALVVMLEEKLAAVCVEALEPELVDWIKNKNIKIVEVPFKDTANLGCNVVALGNGRVLLPASSKVLKEKCLALGLKVYDPDVTMILQGGGGVHCMCQALKRDLV